ncbi:MAG: DUF349 domain-containing protein [Vicinamibacterales bacterium]
MGLLDKLRSQPNWKHADPAIRLGGVQELDPADQEALVSLAKDDPDARVRAAAVARVTAPGTLADIIRNEPDADVREQAASGLAAMAGGADEATAQAAVAALAGLDRQRELAGVARTGAVEAVARAAVGHVSDPRALGGIARHAAHAGVRLVALEQLTAADELEAVALNGEFADTAMAAVERLPAPSPETLQAISQKARTKAAQKKARAILRAAEAQAAPAEAPAVTYAEADEQRAKELSAQMEQLAAAPDIDQLREGYAATRVAWVELLADAVIRPELEAAFEALSDTARDRLAADEAARAEAARAAEALAREQADRAAVCADVEALAGDGLMDRLAEARATWEGMPPMPDTWAGALQHRFDEACRAAEKRHQRLVHARELAERLPLIVPEVEALVGAEDYPSVRNQWYALRKQWQAITRELTVDAELVARYEAASAELETRESALREAKASEQQANLQRLQALVQGLETRAAAEALSLRDAEKLLKDVKLAVGTMGPLPTKQDREDLSVRLQAVRATVTPRIQEMREAEEWKRWANVQVQEELCAKMEALVATAEAEPEKAAAEMRSLQDRWKQAAAAPRSQAETLWTRFKTAQEQVYDKCKDFFAQQAVERQENLRKKEALAAQAEALAESSDWVKTAEALKVLQAEWKAIGPVTRGHEKSVWERFRAACDRFFTRRQDDLKNRKHEWADNLQKKEALIAEAEQLAESTEWDKAAARIKALQAEWKKIGPVRKNKSDVIWQKFRAACDTFFERFKNRDLVALSGKVADRETAVQEIEALVPAPDATDVPAPDDLYPKLQAARARWLQGPDLPRHTLAPLAERVNQAMFALVTRWPDAFAGTDLDPEATRKKMEKLVAKVEALVPTEAKEKAETLSPAELLARQWREALAANTMGAGAARQAAEAKQRAAEQELRSTQSAWLRLGPVPPDVRKPLQDRFDKAVRKALEHRRRAR